jgi:hypothetical protein
MDFAPSAGRSLMVNKMHKEGPIETIARAIAKNEISDDLARLTGVKSYQEYIDKYWTDYTNHARDVLLALAECEIPHAAIMAGGMVVDHPSVFMGGASKHGKNKANDTFSAICRALAEENQP